MWKLCIEDDEGGQTVVPIIRDEITIGRQEGNTIRLTERNVSRRHARLVRREGRLYLEDIAARYGIRKNGSKIEQTEEFTEGDVFLIGDYRLTLQTDRPKAVAPPESASRPPIPSAPPGAIPNKRPSEGTEVLPAMPAKLVIISSNFAGQEFPLARREMVIGRGEECDIIIDHRSVSNKHAKITRDGSTYHIVDLNSKNGLRIGGERYTNVPIKRGDVVELGHVKFRFVEPGENYVFTPQSMDFVAPASPDFGQKKGLNVGVIAAVALVAVLLIGGAVAMMGGGGTDPDPLDGASGQEVAAADTSKAKKADAVPDEPVEDPKVDEGIAEAQKHYEAGDIEKSIGVLEGLDKFTDPSPPQKRAIGDLLSKAKIERPFQQNFIAARADVSKKDWSGAYQSWNEIPEHSIFQGIGEADGLPKAIAAGLVTEARTALDSGDDERAESLAGDALSIDSSLTDAEEILETSRNRAVASASKSATKKRPSDTSPTKKATAKKKSSPSASPISREEAKELAKEAIKAMYNRGNPDEAISLCKRAIKGKAFACYKHMGMAYKQKGQVNQACKNLKKYMRYAPLNEQSKVNKQLENLGCI